MDNEEFAERRKWIMKTRVAVMFGGKSVEHEVSIISGIQAILSMDPEKYEIIPVYIDKANDMYIGEGIGKIESYKDIKKLLAESQRVILVKEDGAARLMPYPVKRFGGKKPVEIDIVFPIVHGTNVEDGTLQGYLKTVGVPFVGCDVTASAVGMDKYVTKVILKDQGVPVLDCKCFTTSDYADVDGIVKQTEESIGYPAIVKPLNLGSSVGISVANDRVELIRSIDGAFTYARKILIEHAISNLREINCSVLGDENDAAASECEEPLHSKDILSYEDKYLSNSKNGASKGMAGVSRRIPAELSVEKREEIRDMAVKSFKALGCNGVARIDFMIDEETDCLYFNEINTIPGSLAFYLWEPVGVSYKELLDRMIQLALKRRREEEALTFSFDTNILNQNSLSGLKGGKL